jgi:uncharacterized paraquat-inducible protein A
MANRRPYTRPGQRSQAKTRPCLRCDRTFRSEGYHNRLCVRCLEYLAAAPSPEPVYSLGRRD